MSATSFSTANQTFRQLFGNGLTYVVPRFQRDYSWTIDECEELWHDIQEVLKEDGEPAHYMGYLVLQSTDSKTFEVVDGQQRLTTLSILALAVLKVLGDLIKEKVDPANNERRSEQLRSSYIGYLDPVSLVSRSKLKLNRNNDDYFQLNLVPLGNLPRRNIRSSEQLLRRSFEFFYEKLSKEFFGRRDGSLLADFLDKLSDRLFFTVINVTNQLNAFKVFETLNARGVRLSPTDLLKNYLFSVVDRQGIHSEELETLERRWERMVDKLGGESFPEFLRAHWNSRNSFVRESELFKVIREKTPDRSAVFYLISQMESDLDTYAALSSPEDALWNNDEKNYIRTLRIFGIRQPWSMLLAAKRNYNQQDFISLLRSCAVVSFRYNVIAGLIPRAQEIVYNKIAKQISSTNLLIGNAIRQLSEIYPRDAEFIAAFANKSLVTTAARNKKVVRYVLFEIEKHVSGARFDVDSAAYNLEHVLPENPGINWTAFPDPQMREYIYRLGNLTLMNAAANRDIGNMSFAEKKSSYEQSEFEITRRIALENEDWNPDRVAARQNWMAIQASSIWRISQLHEEQA